LKSLQFLIIAGSTRGIGYGYGSAKGNDEDGFITLLDLSTGSLLADRTNNKRIGSADDDVIAGICDDPNDPDSFYVVGATKGDVGGIPADQLAIQEGSLHQAFVKKMNLHYIKRLPVPVGILCRNC
jgi:hypothetical protein